MARTGVVAARSISAATVVALLASMTPAVAQQTPAPHEAQTAATQPVEKRVNATMGPVAPMSISVHQEEPGRAGGVGQVTIPVMRRADTGPALRNVTARVRVPQAAQLTQVKGGRWRCDTSRRVATCTLPSLAPSANPAPIYATFSVRKGYSKKRIRVTADATWQGGPVRSRKAAPWLVTGSGSVSISPRLKVKLTSANGPRVVLATNGPDTSRQVGLQGIISNLDDAQASARWRQTRGPQVKMLLPRRLDHLSDRVGQVVQIPDSLRRNATLGFRLIVTANGQRVTRDITVKTTVHRLDPRSAARDHLFTKLAAATLKPQKTVGHRLRTNNRLRLVTKDWRVQPGSRVTVRVRSQRAVARVKWFIDGSPGGSGRKIGVRAPRTPATAVLIAAVVTLRNGTVLQESATLRTSSPVNNEGGDSSDLNVEKVCRIAKDVQDGFGTLTVRLAEDQDLVIQKGGAAVDKPRLSKTCDDGWTIKVTKADLTVPAAKLTDVTATISSDGGLQLTGSSLMLPEALQVGPIEKVSLAPTGDTGARAALVNGEFELLDGSLAVQPLTISPGNTVNGLAWVPLPDGWTFAPNASVVSFINATPDDERLKDNTLRIAQTATGPQDASIAMSADSTDGTWNRLDVTAANIGLGATADGDTLMAAGTGALILGTTGSSIELGISCVKDGQPEADCELFNGLVMKEFGIKLSRKVFGLTGDAGIRYDDPAKLFEFSVVGSYTSAKEWDLKARSTTDWELFNGLSLSDLSGNISMSPVKNQKDKSQLLLGLTGTLKGFQLSDSATLKSLSTTITNRCPETAGKDCKTGEVNFGIDATVTLQAPSGPLDLSAGTLLDLKSGLFTFDFGLQSMEIGPTDLQINKADFILSNRPGEACTPKGQEPKLSSANVFSVTLRAQARVFSADVWMGGTLSKAGSCLWGYPGPMDLSDGLKAKEGVLAYTSYKNGADLSIPRQPEPIALGGNRVQVSGDFVLPGSMMQMFGIPDGSTSPGRLTYLGIYDFGQKGITFELSYTATKEIVMYASQDAATKLTLDKVGFKVTYSSASQDATVQAFADGSLIVPGGGGVLPSRTPMGVSLGFGIGPDGVKAKLQAGVITDKDGVPQPIQNAFGQQGLTVNSLSAALQVAVPITSSEFAVNADVRLPGRWVQNIGVKDNTRVAAAFKLAKTDPCLKIQIGEENVADRTTVVDIANKGFLTAQYFMILIAPKGCTLPVGSTGDTFVKPGYGFAFDGKIIGTTVQVAINSQFEKGLVINGDIVIPSIDLYALKLGGTKPGDPLTISMDIDSAANRYNVKFDAGIDVGQPDRDLGARVRVSGQLRTSDPDSMSLSLTGGAEVKLALIALIVDPLNVDVRIAKPGKPSSLNYARVHADILARVLGFGLKAGGDLVYAGDQLQELRVYAGVDLDVKVAEANGTAEFNYCLGRLSDLSQTGSRCTIFKGTVGAKPAYRVGFYGSYRVLWWSKEYLWTAYDQRGAEGTNPVPDPVIEPNYVPGVVPVLVPNLMGKIGLRETFHDLAWKASDTYIKTVFPAKVDDTKACDRARLGSQWNPTATVPNPLTQPVNPAAGDTCGLTVDMVIGSGDTQRVGVTCTANACTATRGPLAGKVLAADGPNGREAQQGRDALIAGLRTPPGVMPGGATFNVRTSPYGPGLWSPDGKEWLNGFFNMMNYVVMGSTSYRWRSAPGPGKPATDTYRLSKDGQLQGVAADGTILWNVGLSMDDFDLPTENTFLFIQNGFTIYYGDTKDPDMWWGVSKAGKCLPRAEDYCETTTPET